MCLLATSEISHDAVKKHQETVINALKVFACIFRLIAEITGGASLFHQNDVFIDGKGRQRSAARY